MRIPPSEREKIMIIKDNAIAFRKKKGADHFTIRGKIDRNFSGCGCSSEGVTTVRPILSLESGPIPKGFQTLEVNGETVAVEEVALDCLGPDTLIHADKLLFVPVLTLENTTPKVLKE